MFLKDKKSNDMVEILDVDALVDPCLSSVAGRFHWGEEMPEAASFKKADLVFPSGEALPRCWLDAHYKEKSRG